MCSLRFRAILAVLAMATVLPFSSLAAETDPSTPSKLEHALARLADEGFSRADLALMQQGLIEGSWDGSFGTAGAAPGAVMDLVTDGEGRVYLAGSFLTAGGQPSPTIAMWDGNRWHPLGTDSSPGIVLALAVTPDGTLYAGGQFTEIRGVAAKGIAMWDGSSWAQVGSGLDNLIETSFGTNEWVAAMEVGPDGTLYVGGGFTSINGVSVNNIAQFDGTTWSAMGNGINGNAPTFGGGVQTISVVGPDMIYAGGKFGETNTHGEFFETVKFWNGATWQTRAHLTGPIIDIVFDSDTTVFVGGDFSHIRLDFEDGPSEPVGRLIYSESGSGGAGGWQIFGADPNIGVQCTTVCGGPEVFDMKVGSDDNLYVVGDFDAIAGQPVDDAAMLNGAAWTSLGGGVSPGIDDTQGMSIVETAAGFYVGGAFGAVGDLVGVGNIALYTGTAWAPLGNGLTIVPGVGGVVNGLTEGPDGHIYAAGNFAVAGGAATAGVARYDGLRWVGIGTDYTQPRYDVAVGPDTTIYAVGTFLRSDFTSFPVGMWDGTAWVEVGQIATFVNLPPLKIAVNSAGIVYVGGAAVSEINGVPIAGGLEHFVQWDGTEWSVVGGGTDGPVNSIHIDDSDNVYVGGTFDEAGGMAARGIAMWDGSAWSSFGLGFRDNVQAITKGSDGTLYAAGEFESTDFANPIDPNSGTPAKYVAKWDGSAWSQVGNGLNDEVNALAFSPDGILYAAGKFSADGGAGATELNQIAAFDGTNWLPLGGGLNQSGYALHFQNDVGLFVGGDFFVVDGQDAESGTPSGGIGLWRPSGTVAVEEAILPQGSAEILHPNYPNPFRDRTTIPFTVDETARVSVTIYDVIGRHVATLVDRDVAPGTWEVTWEAGDRPAGIYFARLRVGTQTEHRSMTLVR